jgi:hypothetical protein
MKHKVSVAQMAAHIQELLVESGSGFDLTVWRCDRLSEANADKRGRTITVPHVKSVLSYVTCLHEIGHLRGQNQESHYVMEREAGAWDYAKANALVWTPGMERDRVDSLTGYNARHKEIDARPARERAEGVD